MRDHFARFQEAPERCEAERQAGGNQGLPDDQHPDELILFFQDQSSDGPENTEYRKARQDGKSGAHGQRRIRILQEADLQGEHDKVERREEKYALDIAPLRFARRAAGRFLAGDAHRLKEEDRGYDHEDHGRRGVDGIAQRQGHDYTECPH